jgi:hypothetical protein
MVWRTSCWIDTQSAPPSLHNVLEDVFDGMSLAWSCLGEDRYRCHHEQVPLIFLERLLWLQFFRQPHCKVQAPVPQDLVIGCLKRLFVHDMHLNGSLQIVKLDGDGGVRLGDAKDILSLLLVRARETKWLFLSVLLSSFILFVQETGFSRPCLHTFHGFPYRLGWIKPVSSLRYNFNTTGP